MLYHGACLSWPLLPTLRVDLLTLTNGTLLHARADGTPGRLLHLDAARSLAEQYRQSPREFDQANGWKRGCADDSESIQIYNQQRPHLSLKMKTPDEVHRASIAAINQSEKSRSQVST